MEDMTIKQALDFVKGAVAKKALSSDMQSLTHYTIHNGKVMGANGVVSMSSPIPLDISANPNATKFLASINSSKKDITLHLTATGRLVVKSGNYRAIIDCIEEAIPVPTPEGKKYALDSPILPILKKLVPIISEDASRPWSRGLLLSGNSIFATNNVIVVEHHLAGDPFPVTIVIPRDAVMELLRIGVEPEFIQVTDTQVSFLYEQGQWLRTQLLENKWPDIYKILNTENNAREIHQEMLPLLKDLRPFLDDMERIWFTDKGLSTHNSDEQAASQALETGAVGAVFQYKYLMLTLALATTIDFAAHPKPCIFYGAGLRGALIGLADRWEESA